MKLTFQLHQTPEFVFDYLTDMQKYGAVHPVISKIEPTGPHQYLVFETLRFLGIPISFTYPVTVVGDLKEGTVRMHATVMKFTHIHMCFSIKEVRGVAVVDETTSFKSMLPVTTIMERIFKKQHTQLFKNLAEVRSDSSL